MPSLRQNLLWKRSFRTLTCLKLNLRKNAFNVPEVRTYSILDESISCITLSIISIYVMLTLIIFMNFDLTRFSVLQPCLKGPLAILELLPLN